jgi:SAM-dependent methyltransferase
VAVAALWLTNVEYVGLRVLRRFVFRDALLRRVGRWLPYYLVNQGETSASPIVDVYARQLAAQGWFFQGKTALEIGVGATNSTGYELLARGCARVICQEPLAALDGALDARLRRVVADRSGIAEETLASAVVRVRELREVATGAVDFVFSHSVLEHVREVPGLAAELDRVLRTDGAMVHVVDYRDHFFKYPYHFLQFPRATWERYLDPGDLPRVRLSDHLRQFSDAGFAVRATEIERDGEGFRRVRPRLSPDFDPSDDTLDVLKATLLAVKSGALPARQL